MWNRIIKNRTEKVEVSNIGLYLKLITMDSHPANNQELAVLISSEFNINCTEKDIDVYNALHVEHNHFENLEIEDYEKLSRMHEFNMEHYIE